MMERRVMGNHHARCGAGENPAITSKDYLSLFFWRDYQAHLEVTARTMPDSRVPTARQGSGAGWSIKSGYGINAEVSVVMTSDGGDGNIAPVQHVSSVFPDFDFEKYNRLLEPGNGRVEYSTVWQFKPNEYSQFVNPVHFTPVWYPDGQQYPVSFTVMCAWTPAGELRYTVTSSDITIQGNVYDDWHVAPGFES